MKITQTLKDYVNRWTHVVKTRDGLSRLLEGTKKFSKSEMFVMLDYYDKNSEDELDNIYSMNKEELEEYALREFRVDLDKRRSLEALLVEVDGFKVDKLEGAVSFGRERPPVTIQYKATPSG